MTPLRLLLVAFAAVALTGMARKPTLSVRFFVEAKANDGGRFTVPVKLTNPTRDAFMSSIPAISEINIVAVYPVQTSPGSWGCAFKLDEDGRLKLETLSRAQRGTSMIVIVQTKGGSHQVADILIDKPVSDGILYVSHGFTAMEIAVLAKEFRLFGPAAAAVPKVKRHWWN
jgi:hypothetical protein